MCYGHVYLDLFRIVVYSKHRPASISNKCEDVPLEEMEENEDVKESSPTINWAYMIDKSTLHCYI